MGAHDISRVAGETDRPHRAIRAAGVASVTASAAAAVTLAGAGTAMADTQPGTPNVDHLAGSRASCTTHGGSDSDSSDSGDLVDGAIGDVPGLRDGFFGDDEGCFGGRSHGRSMVSDPDWTTDDDRRPSATNASPESDAPRAASHPTQAASPAPDSVDSPPPPGQIRKIKLPSMPMHR